MTAYSKLIAAAVGLIIMVGKDFLNLDLTAHAQTITEIVIAVLTAAGVYLAPNKKEGA